MGEKTNGEAVQSLKWAAYFDGSKPCVTGLGQLETRALHIEVWLRPARARYVTTFTEANLSGHARRIANGALVEIGEMDPTVRRIGSIEITSGMLVVLFDQPHCRGNARRISATTFDLGDWAARVQSMLVVNAADARQPALVLYSQPQFAGMAAAVRPGTYHDLASLAFTPGSADLPPGLELQLFTRPGLQGESITISGAQADLGDTWRGKAQSMVVTLGGARERRPDAFGRGGATAIFGNLLRLTPEAKAPITRAAAWTFGGRTLVDQVWCHLAITSKDGHHFAYLNGTETGELNVQPQDSPVCFQGSIAMIRVWRTQPSPDAFGSSRLYLAPHPAPPDLAEEWTLDAAGTSWVDSVSGKKVPLPAELHAVAAGMPGPPNASPAAQSMLRAMDLHGQRTLGAANEQQRIAILKAHQDAAESSARMHTSVRAQARLKPISNILFSQSTGFCFLGPDGHQTSEAVNTNGKPFGGAFAVNPRNGDKYSGRSDWIFVSKGMNKDGGGGPANVNGTGRICAMTIDPVPDPPVLYWVQEGGQICCDKPDDVSKHGDTYTIGTGRVLLEQPSEVHGGFHFFADTWSIALDHQRNILYWSNGREIFHASVALNANPDAVKLSAPSALPVDHTRTPAPLALAVEPKSGALIWVDQTLGKIRSALPGSRIVRDLYDAPNPAAALGIDPEMGTLLWASEFSPPLRGAIVDSPGLFLWIQDRGGEDLQQQVDALTPLRSPKIEWIDDPTLPNRAPGQRVLKLNGEPLEFPTCLLDTSAGLTVELWIRFDSLPENFLELSMGGSWNHDRGSTWAKTVQPMSDFRMGFTVQDVHLYAAWGGVGANESNARLCDYQFRSEWTHLVFTIDEKGVPSFFRDGAAGGFLGPCSSGSLQPWPVPPLPRTRVRFAEGLKGALGGMRMWNRGLSAEEVKALYDCGPGDRQITAPGAYEYGFFTYRSPGTVVQVGDVEGKDPAFPLCHVDVVNGFHIASEGTSEFLKVLDAHREFEAAAAAAASKIVHAHTDKHTAVENQSRRTQADLEQAKEMVNKQERAGSVSAEESGQRLTQASADASRDKQAANQRLSQGMAAEDAKKKAAILHASQQAQQREDEATRKKNDADSQLRQKEEEKRRKGG